MKDEEIFDHWEDSKVFTDYRRKIKAVLLTAKEPITIGELHRRLGEENVRREWTLDALHSLGADRSWCIPTRYSLPEKDRLALPYKKKWETFSVKSPHKRKTEPTPMSFQRAETY